MSTSTPSRLHAPHHFLAEWREPSVHRLLGGDVADAGLAVVVHELQMHQAFGAHLGKITDVPFQEVCAFRNEHHGRHALADDSVERLHRRDFYQSFLCCFHAATAECGLEVVPQLSGIRLPKRAYAALLMTR
jgi:hypothetical protein